MTALYGRVTHREEDGTPLAIDIMFPRTGSWPARRIAAAQLVRNDGLCDVYVVTAGGHEIGEIEMYPHQAACFPDIDVVHDDIFTAARRALGA